MQLVNAWLLLLLWPTTVSANTPCGTIPLGSTNRLVGGLPADVLDWPWQALLLSHQYYQVSEVSSHRIYGGGTVISNKWVLTAAHIFEHAGLQKSFGTKKWNRLLVILGMTSYPKVGGKIADSVFAFEPGDVILHEKFDHETYDFDIALIKFGEAKKVRGSRFIPNSHVKEIPFGNYIQPICLPCLNSCDKTGGTSFNADACREYATSIAPADLPIIPDVTVTGYGSTVARDPVVNNFKYPETLQKAKLVLLDNNSCKDGLKKVNEIYSSIKHNVIAQYTHQMLCALGKHQENFSDSCQGDSGGPLVKQVVSTNGSKCWTQIGIVSWGLGCASRPDDGGFIPGFYANVASLMGWVLEKMGIRKVLQSDGTILCPRLTPPKNGYFSGNAEHREVGSVVTLACNEGYTLKGKNSSKCIATAVWEPFATCQGAWSDWISWSTCSETCRGIQERTRFCEDKNCSGKNKEVRLCNTLGCLPMCAPVEAPLDGTMSVTPTPDVFYPGTVVEFFCDEGWFLKGPSSIICQPNENWSDERNPVCGKSDGCEPRQAPSHGSMAVTPDPHSFYPGTIVQFSCDKEWLLQDGPSSITCNDDNTWSDEARPACQEFKCQAPPELPNGKVTGHGFKLWSARYFACNPGFNLQGHRVSRCNRKGVWTGRKRSCVVYRCSDPVPPQNGIISHYESGVGGRTTFECNDGFLMEGSNFAICNESGRWGPTPTCKVSIARTRVSDPRTCHPPAVPINGHIKEQKSTYGDGEYVVFECSSGMVMDGQSWTQCLGSDTYRYPSPACSARTSCLGSCTYIEDAHCQCDSGCFWAGTCCLDHFVYCNSNFQFP